MENSLNKFLSDSFYNEGYDQPHVLQEDVTLHEIIGHGSFAHVKRGTYKGETVAVKEIMRHYILTEEQVRETVRSELKNSSRLRNQEFVTQVIGYYIADDTVSILLSYAANGDLKKYLAQKKLKGNWRKKASICADIAKGLISIHSKNVIHGDLKASNILLDEFLKPKISDFGVSRTFTSVGKGKDFGHTLRHIAPERLGKKWSKEKHTHEQLKQSDIFGFGLIMWEVATDGESPYRGAENSADILIRKQQKEDHLQSVGDPPKDTPAVFRAMMSNCLQAEPSSRMPLNAVYEALRAYANESSLLDNSVSPSKNTEDIQAVKERFVADRDIYD
ncbi:kinase-like domain-containing protein, partial [Endogone sp. FLAS-F59071]